MVRALHQLGKHKFILNWNEKYQKWKPKQIKHLSQKRIITHTICYHKWTITFVVNSTEPGGNFTAQNPAQKPYNNSRFCEFHSVFHSSRRWNVTSVIFLWRLCGNKLFWMFQGQILEIINWWPACDRSLIVEAEGLESLSVSPIFSSH